MKQIAKLYEHDFGIYLYKLAEAKTAEETKKIEDEIVLKLMAGVVMKVEFRRRAKRSEWFYGLSGLEYGKRPCQSF